MEDGNKIIDLEISPLKIEFTDYDGRQYVELACEGTAEFFGLYARLKCGEVQHISDFRTRDAAISMKDMLQEYGKGLV
jgi:hypothetical protein